MTSDAPFGLLLVDKPAGPTSHEVVDWVRWTTRVKAVGHCGTLDPRATGLLLVCVGAATKLAGELSGADKTYEAEFLLGQATDSADLDGRVVAEATPASGDRERAWRELEAMVGPLNLAPPLVSAVHVEGRRAHELAREGAEVELPTRPMHVLALERLAEPEGEHRVRVLVRVGKGTYVRSLAVELGRRLELPVVLSALHRTASGGVALDAATLGELAVNRLPDAPNGAPRHRLRFPGELSRAEAGARILEALRSPWTALGRPISDARAPGPLAQALERLAQGQRLAAEVEPGSAIVTGDEGTGVVLGEGLAVLVRREPGPEQRPRIAPERVIRWGARSAPAALEQERRSVDIAGPDPDAPRAQK